MSKTAQLHTSQKFEHLPQDTTKIFSLTQLCYQQSMLHKQNTSKILCGLAENTQGKQETPFICILTNVNWNRKVEASLYSESRHTVIFLQTHPWARHGPKAIQLHPSSWELLTERRMCLVKWLVSWLPDCSCVMALRDKIQSEKGLDCLLLVWQHAHLGFPNTQAVCGGPGTLASLVLWQVTVCLCVLIESLGTVCYCSAASSVSCCSVHFWKMSYKTAIL